jgi:thiamine-phosphate pyrophosphorylase
MPKAQPADVQRTASRLYLVTPPIAETRDFVDRLGAAIADIDIAAVLLRLAPVGERESINRIKALAGRIQSTGAALLIDGQPDIAARGGADGAHLTGIAAFTAAVESLKPARIAGCGGLKTRHDAMVAAERGADYVMFGEIEGSGRRPPFAAIIERVEWWAPLFEIPCVGFAAELGEVAPLAIAGAEFIAIGDAIWDDPRGPTAALADAAQRLSAPETVA